MIRQFNGGVRLHQFLYRRLHLPRHLADAGVRTVKYLYNPTQQRVRRSTAPTCIRDGYWFFETLPDASPVVADCLEAFHNAEAELATITARSKKRFLHSVLRDTDFLRVPSVMKLILGEPLECASGYLGTVPLVTSVRLWWTPPNSSVEDSQLFHCDGEDQRQLKFFVNILPTTPQSGPFTFVGAADSERIKRRLGYIHGRVTDDVISAPVYRLIGPAGSGAAVDTSRCFHYGSRGNTEDRLILMFQFTRFYAPKVSPIRWGIPQGIPLTASQRLALGFT